jgi:NAD(P) transhydrogenase subunit beta
MPILNVDRAGTVIVVKRSLSPGFAGIDNPLFYEENTLMFFADAKEALEQTVSALRSL